MSRRARLALAIGLAVLAVPLLPAAGHAASPALALAVHLGYHDVIKTGQWMPVAIDVQNAGPDFRGTIEVQLQDNPSRGIPPNYVQPQGAVYQLDFTLPAGASKHVRTYVVSDVPGSPVTVRLVGDGRVLATQTASGATTANLLVGVLSDDPTAFDEFGALRFPAGNTAQVVHLNAGDLAGSAVLLRAFDLIAIDDFASDSLTATQRSAIEGYVAMGGSLLLGSGSSWRKTLTALPAALLPMRVSGTVTRPEPAAFGSSLGVELAAGTSSGAAWLRDGAQPLVLERALGSGLVTMATFDWTQEPAASSSGTRALLRQVGVRSGFGNQSGSAPGIGGGGTFWLPIAVQSGSVTQRGNLFIQALSNIPALDLPSLRLTGLLVLLYVLLIGPLNYLILRRLGRRELAWVTVPVIAVVFAAGAYGIALGTKGRSVQGTQIGIVHVMSGWDQAYQETYTGIFAPTRGDYTITVAGSSPAIAPIATVYGGMGPIGGSTRVRPEHAQLDLLGVTAFTLRGFATESTVAAPRLTGSLSLRNGRLSGVIHNASTLTFTDAVVIAGDGYQTLGELKPGADQAVDVLAQPISVFGAPPAIFRVYPNTMYGPPAAATVSQREGEERTAVIQDLLNGINGPVTPRIAPMVIAWTHDPVEAIQVNGVTPRLQMENAVVLPLAITEVASGALAAGLVPARLVDASGDVQIGPSGVFLNGGTATYELTAPLKAGARIVGAAITSANPYGLKFAPVAQPLTPGGSPVTSGGTQPATLTSELWNWQTGAWMPYALKDNATTALPDGALDPSTGTVRVRLTGTTGSVPAQMGAMSLTGSVQ
ncbi:MAG TPA: hypothetical protein VET65_01250 [Candidatus Limnocylindrales bacterium]|nr:hypothetical protein [Candidatus Limnocylindrales bacterium]